MSMASSRRILSKNPLSILPVTEHYAERYGNIDGIVRKINQLLGSITSVMENDIYRIGNPSLVNSFELDCRTTLDVFDREKIELAEAQCLMKDILDQIIHNHQSVSQICENIAQETQKRYTLHENYSEDGSYLIVGDDEKRYLGMLSLKIDSFLLQKMALLETLEKVIKLTWNTIVHKKSLYTKFAEHYYLNNYLTNSTTENHAQLEKFEVSKIFKRFPENDLVHSIIKLMKTSESEDRKKELNSKYSE